MELHCCCCVYSVHMWKYFSSIESYYSQMLRQINFYFHLFPLFYDKPLGSYFFGDIHVKTLIITRAINYFLIKCPNIATAKGKMCLTHKKINLFWFCRNSNERNSIKRETMGCEKIIIKNFWLEILETSLDKWPWIDWFFFFNHFFILWCRFYRFHMGFRVAQQRQIARLHL